MARRTLSTKSYLAAFLALLVLAAGSFGLSFLHLGAFSMPLALGVATLKACIVAGVFMHLLEEPGTRSLATLIAVMMVCILITLAATDVATR
ncbi:MAG: cytochrome C oxidase subunit IV family protein [Myxococcales bacterium]|nr:cytochrome C oxidase subunit IV family protein [Myxococcales bacterium]